jgi:DNA-binding SARP family transcriptional activator
VMEIYARSGRIAQAVRQYQSCRDILSSELGIAPAEETVLLHGRISRDVAIPASSTQPSTKMVGIENRGKAPR